MTMLGMNPASVEAIGESIAARVATMTSEIDGCSTALSQLEWVGNDADAFRAAFAAVVDSGLSDIEQLRRLGERATEEAAQQVAVSSS